MNLNGKAAGIADFLTQRNFDIGGYWGVGLICRDVLEVDQESCTASFSGAVLRDQHTLELCGHPIDALKPRLLRILVQDRFR